MSALVENLKYGSMYFLTKLKSLASVKFAQKSRKLTRSSTKNLSGHLKSCHNVTIKSCYEIDTEPKNKLPRLDFFNFKQKPTLGEVISKLVAVDRLSFNQVAQSDGIRRAFKSDGYEIPISSQALQIHS